MVSNKSVASFFAFAFGRFIHSAISFLTTPLVTFLVAPSEFGKASMFNLAYSVLIAIVRVGSDSAFVRYFHENPGYRRQKLLWSCLTICFVMLSFVSLVLVAFWKFFSRIFVGSTNLTVVFVMIFTLLVGMFQYFGLQNLRMQNMGWLYSTAQVVDSVARIVGIVSFAKLLGNSFLSLLWGQLLGMAASFVFAFLLDPKIWILTAPDAKIVKDVLSYGLPLFPSNLMGWFFRSVDKVIVRTAINFESLGVYTVAQKVAGVLSLFQAGFSAFWAPTAYSRYFHSRDGRAFFSKAADIVAASMFSLGTLTVMFKDLLFLIVSRGYTNASEVAPFLVLVPLFATLSETTMIGISLSGKTYWFTIVSFIAGALNTLGAWLLVPHFGAKGAAISFGVSYVFIFSARTLVSMRLFKVRYDLARIYLATTVILIQCSIATFLASKVLNFMVGICALTAVLVLYKREIFSWMMPTFVELATRLLKRR